MWEPMGSMASEGASVRPRGLLYTQGGKAFTWSPADPLLSIVWADDLASFVPTAWQ